MATDNVDERITELLVEQLRVPLVQIRQLLEQGGAESVQSATIVSAQSLRALDGFLLTRQQTTLRFEPVSVGAVLYDVAHELSPLAMQYGRELRLDHRAKYGSLMADRAYLEQLLGLVGEVMIKLPLQERELREVVLGSHRSQDGVVAGAFTPRTTLPIADREHGVASWQPSASIEIASLLARRLETVLRPYKHLSMPGVGIRLTPSRQLRLWT